MCERERVCVCVCVWRSRRICQLTPRPRFFFLICKWEIRRAILFALAFILQPPSSPNGSISSTWLRAAFTLRRFQKRKKLLDVTVFLRFLNLYDAKAVRKMLVKLTPSVLTPRERYISFSKVLNCLKVMDSMLGCFCVQWINFNWFYFFTIIVNEVHKVFWKQQKEI